MEKKNSINRIAQRKNMLDYCKKSYAKNYTEKVLILFA